MQLHNYTMSPFPFLGQVHIADPYRREGAAARELPQAPHGRGRQLLYALQQLPHGARAAARGAHGLLPAHLRPR